MTAWGLAIFVLLVALATWRVARAAGPRPVRPPPETLRFRPRTRRSPGELPRGARD